MDFRYCDLFKVWFLLFGFPGNTEANAREVVKLYAAFLEKGLDEQGEVLIKAQGIFICLIKSWRRSRITELWINLVLRMSG